MSQGQQHSFRFVSQVRKSLSNRSVCLGSSSPRRKELLARIVDNFNIAVSDYDERSISWQQCTPSSFVARTARGKLDALLRKGKTQSDLIVCADTMVFNGNAQLLGKPRDRDEAVAHLRSLSGRRHSVYTGLCIFIRIDNDDNDDDDGLRRRIVESFDGDDSAEAVDDGVVVSAVERTFVDMVALDDDEIGAYIDTGEPMDKAGAYGIQALGSTLVRSIEGCYFNVMGFPIARFASLLSRCHSLGCFRN
jgi:nucleoside triphosphate pyrophosphatase